MCEACGAGLNKSTFASGDCEPCGAGTVPDVEHALCLPCQDGLVHWFHFDKPQMPGYDDVTGLDLAEFNSNTQKCTYSENGCNVSVTVDGGDAKLQLDSSYIHVEPCWPAHHSGAVTVIFEIEHKSSSGTPELFLVGNPPIQIFQIYGNSFFVLDERTTQECQKRKLEDEGQKQLSDWDSQIFFVVFSTDGRSSSKCQF